MAAIWSGPNSGWKKPLSAPPPMAPPVWAKAEIGADGVGCEPASAVTLAGLKKLVKQGFVKPGESVVLILTGHLLKDPEFTLKFHRGDLFVGTPHEKAATVLVRQQRTPLVLDARVDAVLETLEKFDRAGSER